MLIRMCEADYLAYSLFLTTDNPVMPYNNPPIGDEGDTNE